MDGPGLPADLLLPDYDGACLRAVLPAAVAALGLDLPDVVDEDSGERAQCSGGDPPASALEALGLAPADRVCVVLVDGLGLHMLLERGGHAPYLRAALPEARTLTTGFPATTATSLTMVGTGLTPGCHGVLGYTLRDPRSGELTNMLTWGGSARPEAWQPCATIFERLSAAGARVVSIGKERFRASGLTQAALRGGDFVSGVTLGDRVDAAIRLLRDRSTRLVYVYWGEVDAIGHHKGWGSWEWGEQVSAVDSEIRRLVRGVPSGTTVLVTADHGMVDVGHRDKIDVAHTPALSEGVELVAGEPRALHVYCRAGRVDDVASRWHEELGDSAWVVTRDDADRAGLFGGLAERHRAVVGDVLVVTRGHRAVLDSRVQTPQSLGLVGMHGSLTPAEALVPLIVEER